MHCDECLTSLAHADLEQLAELPGIADHVKHCARCKPAAQLLVEASHEARRRVALAQSRRSDAELVRGVAAAVERRRRVRIVYAVAVLGLLIAAVMSFGRLVSSIERAKQEMFPTLTTVTLTLNCISSQDAGNLISPYLRSHGSIYRLGSGPLNVITVRATDTEIAQVRGLLARFDQTTGGRCAAGKP